MSNRKLPEDVEESLYKKDELYRHCGDKTKTEAHTSKTKDADDDDSGLGLKQSPSWNEDDDKAWSSTATFYQPHPALSRLESTDSNCNKKQ